MVNITERISYLSQYLEYLKLCNEHNVPETIKFIEETALKTKNISACLAVIYPKHHWRTGIKLIDYRGPDRFLRKELPEQRSICELERIWGYKCNNPLNSDDIQYDHLWPYALGGATNVDNLLALCPFHNFIKSNDYHWYPFEIYQESPTWVLDQVLAIYRQLKS